MALLRCAKCRAKVSDRATACPKCGTPTVFIQKRKYNRITSCTGCLTSLIIVAAIIAAFIARDKGNALKPSGPPDIQATPAAREQLSTPMPQHEVVDRNTYDTPVKTQVVLHSVVFGTITESGLRQLLEKLHNEARTTSGLKYQEGKPTHVAIYLYTSREHFESGMGQWIAMLSQIGSNSRAVITVKTELIPQLTATPEVTHGLTETKRKEIFREIVKAEDRADADAQKRCPLPNPAQPGYTSSGAKEQFKKQMAAMYKLATKYKAELAKQHGLTEAQLREIGLEGAVNNWPLP